MNSLPYLGPHQLWVAGLWAHTAALRRVWRVVEERRGGVAADGRRVAIYIVGLRG